MNCRLIISSAFIFIAFSIQIRGQNSGFDLNNQTYLDAILKKCEEYSEKVKNASLHFVCIEKVKEEIVVAATNYVVTSPGSHGSFRTYSAQPKWEKNRYVYDYQLIKKGDRITEKRILLEENGKERHLENAPLKTKRFYSRWSALGPVILFSKNWQTKYSYRLIKEGKYKKERVYIIEAKPKKDIKEKLNYGKVWVNKEDGSIMKMEIDMESLPGFEELKEESKRKRIKPVFTTVHHYEYIKNGIRFPSKTSFEESYVRRGRRTLKSKTTFVYTDYRFFVVETDHVIKRDGT